MRCEEVYCFEGETPAGKLFTDSAHIERAGVPNGDFLKVLA